MLTRYGRPYVVLSPPSDQDHQEGEQAPTQAG